MSCTCCIRLIQQEMENMGVKIDDVKLGEITYMMAYGSVQYLSTQFKSVTGVSVSDFKKDPAKYRKPLESLIK